MQRLAIFTIVALAAIGVAIATLPFHLTGFPSELWRMPSAEHCSAPIVSAFRNPHNEGWLGYAPLTNTPIDVGVKLPSCKTQGQRRLQYAGMLVLAAGVLAITLRRNSSEASGPRPDPIAGGA
jgi:hypothetical protein